MGKVTAILDINPFFESLAKKTKEIDDKLVKEIRVTGAMVETDYKKVVPVDFGRLKTSIHLQHSDYKAHSYNDRKGNSFDGTLSTSPDRYTVFVGTNVEYAPVIENGFSGTVTVKSHRRTSRSGRSFTVRGHSRMMNRPAGGKGGRGAKALEKAFDKNVSGLMDRLAKLIK